MKFHVRREFIDEDTRLPQQVVGITELLLDVPITQGHNTDPYWVRLDGFEPIQTSVPMTGLSYGTVAEAFGILLGHMAQQPDHESTASYIGLALRARAYVVNDSDGEIHLRRSKLGGSIPNPNDMPGAVPVDIAHVYIVGHPPAQAYRDHGDRYADIGSFEPDSDLYHHATAITDALHAMGSRNPDDALHTQESAHDHH